MQVITILIILACLATNTNVCRKETVINIQTAYVQPCGVVEDKILEKWKEQHPNLIVSDWTCTQKKIWHL